MTENTYERVDRMRKYLTEELPPEEHVSFTKELKEKGYFHQKLPISLIRLFRMEERERVSDFLSFHRLPTSTTGM